AIWELIHDTSREPCPLPMFYEDLDATFEDTDHNGLYDTRYWGDNDGPEIWVSNWFMPLKTIPSSNLDPWGTGATGGLLGRYYNDTSKLDFVGQRVDPLMDLNLNQSFLPTGVDAERFSAEWTGKIIANETGPVEFTLEVAGGARLYVGGVLLIDHYGGSTNGVNTYKAARQLTKGSNDIKVEFYKWDGGYRKNGSLFVGWDSPWVEVLNFNDYFDKTHLYHTGRLGQPEKGLLFMDYPYGYKCNMLEPIRDMHLYPLYGENLVVGGGKNSTSSWEFLDVYEPGYELLSIWSHACGKYHQFQVPEESGYPTTNLYYHEIRGMNGATITLIWGCHAADFGDTGYVWTSDIDQNVAINHAFNTKYGLVSSGCTRSYGTTYRETYHCLKNRSTVADGYLAYKDYSYNYSLRYQTNPDNIDRWIDDEALFGDPFVTSDHIPGDLKVTINDGRKFVNDTSVTLHLYSNNPGEMSLRDDNGEWTDWMPYAAEAAWDLNVSAGYGKVHFRMRNVFGEGWTEASAAVGFDITPPTITTLTINDGGSLTNSTSAVLKIRAEDDLSGPESLRTSVDGSSWSEWFPFSTTVPFSLDGPDGPKTVYVQVRDVAGHFSSVISSSIVLDTTPPVTLMELEGEEGSSGWYTSGIVITLSCSDPDVDRTVFVKDWDQEQEYTSPIHFLENGEHVLVFWSEDTAGNREVQTTLGIRIDRELPNGWHLVINEDEDYTTSRDVVLSIEAYDTISGCSEIRIRSDGANWGQWQDFDNSIPYHLGGQEGQVLVEIMVRDTAGNEDDAILSDTIILDMTSPGFLGSYPLPDQTDVPLDAWIVVNFTEEVLLDPLDGEPIAVLNSRGARVFGTVDFWNLSTMASFKPAGPLDPFEEYQVVINDKIVDRAGNPIITGQSFNITTVGVPPPGVEDVFIYRLDMNATISWSEPPNEEGIPIEGYRVYRREGNTILIIFEGGPEENSCLDSSLDYGNTYHYSVAAFNSYGESPRSPEFMLVTPDPPEEWPPDDELPDDDDEEPVIDDDDVKDKGAPVVLWTVLVILIILVLLAGIGGYIYLTGKRSLEELYEPE
ncbi:MAG: PA14 domain-containing protein, partial [Thermoplasmatota archaeon]